LRGFVLADYGRAKKKQASGGEGGKATLAKTPRKRVAIAFRPSFLGANSNGGCRRPSQGQAGYCDGLPTEIFYTALPGCQLFKSSWAA